MARVLPRLRSNLDFMPSPLPERPGLLIRDALQYSDVTLIIPPALVRCLQCFDGSQTDLDLRAMLVRMTGDLRAGEAGEQLFQSLKKAGFLEDEVYEELRERKHREFRAAAWRDSVLAGSSYPEDPGRLRTHLQRLLGAGVGYSPLHGLLGIAAPHVSLEGGGSCYRAAYGALDRNLVERTFVILGTSHYGEPEAFGLTKKPYRTPLGESRTASDLVEELERRGGPAVRAEDYCHAVEHSIEFQVLALQYTLGPEVEILPILCGSYGRSIQEGGKPEDNPGVAQFLEVLRDLASREAERLVWVLGVDLAHVGRRYGDNFSARAGQGFLLEVERRDRERLERVIQGDADGFWELIREGRDDLHWCGSSALYTFLRACPAARGTLLHYAQWNIDPDSVVTFAAIAFQDGSGQLQVS